MIEYVRGELAELTPSEAVVDAGGVGYGMLISLGTYTALQGKREAKLYVFEQVREDAYQLYGFATRQERTLFELLLSVSGIGGQTARMMLSAFSPAELCMLIQSEDARSIKSVKGVGPKAAQRVIVELKDKVAVLLGEMPSLGNSGPAANAVVDPEKTKEAVGALQTLGFPPAAAHKCVQTIIKDQPSLPVEGVIKLALKML